MKLNKELLKTPPRDKGEELVIDAINDQAREIERINQILDFISSVANQQANEEEKKDNGELQ